jgi:SAM-dependent methyltransferase
MTDMTVGGELLGVLRCPACQGGLQPAQESLRCVSCGKQYPVLHGCPVLIDSEHSVFSAERILASEADGSGRRTSSRLARFLPAMATNLCSARNYRALARELGKRTAPTRVLVVGAGESGIGMQALAGVPGVEVVNTDVYYRPNIEVIADGHRLPFAAAAFDAVVLQAVLEHVVEPQQCVAEVHRVLKADGYVYAETPFMQQVHGERYDFTRFTHLGHRRLFRGFAELDSGVVAGPGSVLAWSYQYFLTSFFRRGMLRNLALAFARFTGFWISYFDWISAQRPGAYDGASCLYFFGRRTDTALTDRELLAGFRGV